MSRTKILDPVDRYIKDVRKFLPYPDRILNSILIELKQDVLDAIGTDKRPPSVVFGSPFEVAKNISLSKDWGTQNATWIRRTLAFSIDFFFLSSILFIFVIFPFLSFLERPEEFPDRLWFFVGMNLLISVPSILFTFIYFIFLEKTYSATIGKKLMGLVVVDEVGIKISWSQSLIRNMTKIPFTGQFLLFDTLIGMFSEKTRANKQRALDLVAGTVVVQQNKQL